MIGYKIKKLKKPLDPLLQIGFSFVNEGQDVASLINQLASTRGLKKCSFCAYTTLNDCIGVIFAREYENYIEIIYLFISSIFRKQGIGSALVDKVVNYAKEKNKELKLYCNKLLIPFYSKKGFITDENLVVMVKGK